MHANLENNTGILNKTEGEKKLKDVYPNAVISLWSHQIFNKLLTNMTAYIYSSTIIY